MNKLHAWIIKKRFENYTSLCKKTSVKRIPLRKFVQTKTRICFNWEDFCYSIIKKIWKKFFFACKKLLLHKNIVRNRGRPLFTVCSTKNIYKMEISRSLGWEFNVSNRTLQFLCVPLIFCTISLFIGTKKSIYWKLFLFFYQFFFILV